MRKPDKPTEKLPENFGGIKETFSQDKINYGYQPDIPDILGGANVNYLIDTLGDNNRYFNTICDFITDMPVAKTITVNENNELVYRDWLGGRNFGELVYSSIPLSDSSLKLLDGSLIQGSGIYKNFVDYIATIVNTYPSLFTTEENWQVNVTQYGVCGKYVYNSTNNTVRIPKVTGIIEGTVDVNALGNIVAAGLPLLTTNTGGNHTHNGTTSVGTPHSHTRGTMNITGTFRLRGTEGSSDVSGAFSAGEDGGSWGRGHENAARNPLMSFDASRAWTGSTSSESSHTHSYNISSSGSHSHNINWGANTNTVQPQTVKMFVYIVVATGVTKTDVELDIDEIVTDLNYKADKDLSNISELGQAKFDNLQNSIDTKISKSGDTMSGSLQFSKIGGGVISLNAISEGGYSDIQYTMANDLRAGFIRANNVSATERNLQISVCNDSGSPTSNIILSCKNNVNSCTFPNTTCVDGQWVSLSNQNNSIASDVTLPIGNDLELEYDLSSYLPNDSYNYEVTFSVDAETGNGSGAGLFASLTGLSWARVCAIIARGSWVMTMANNATCIIGTNRKVKLLYTVSSKNAKLNYFFIEGYRRLGTNA